MAETVIMPKLGFNMSEGKLVRWHKEVGDSIKMGEIFFEIETDKTTMEIESTADGTVLKLLVEEGDSVPVTSPIAVIGEKGEDIVDLMVDAEGKFERLNDKDGDMLVGVLGKQNSSKPESSSALNNSKLTPRARKLVADKKLDISKMKVEGTGFDGGITARDILRYMREHKEVKATPVAKKLAEIEEIDLCEVTGSGFNSKIMKVDVEKKIEEKNQIVIESLDSKEVQEVIPYTGMRKIIGDRLSRSKFTAPHLYFITFVDVSKLLKLKEETRELVSTKISINDFIVTGVVQALKKYPQVNSTLNGDQIVIYKNINMGIAVALENGVIVPVVKDADKKKLSEIAQEMRELVERARNNKLTPDEYSGGTFTVSNLGMFGIENFTAIINPPEAAILAVSAIKKTPVVISGEEGDEIVIRPIMKLTLSVDHRLIDGVLATKFINKVKELLENPMKILV
ncbi:MAG: dihydrolipoamide acetyltransferase [Clostridiales bacterium]|jgi:pyruvate dehydrogenase E2 component (dihydrolipoamide acetyltransferase)|nr:dihydrolipoamide acetyltransferase [Clostridiales bacterium]